MQEGEVLNTVRNKAEQCENSKRIICCEKLNAYPEKRKMNHEEDGC